jgi:outer membrane protein
MVQPPRKVGRDPLKHLAFLAGAMIAGGAAFAGAASGQTAAQPVRPLSLSEALDYASSHYPSVRATLAQKVAAEKDVDVARAAYLPQVNLLWQISRSTVNNFDGILLPQSVIPSISGPVLPQTGQTAWNSGAGALVTWRPFDFGYRASRVDAARQAETVAAQSVALTELDVLTATANAYMNLVAAQSLAKVAQANVERLQAFSRAIHVLVANKLRPGVDGEQADAAEALARTGLVSALGNVEVQQATLAKLVGRPAEGVIVDGVALTESPPAASVEATPRSPDAHPAAVQEAARVKQQDAQLRAIDRSYAPQVDIVGSVSGRGSGKSAAGAFLGGDAGLSPDIGNWAVGVQVTLALGSYPALHSQQQAQRARLSAERDRYEQTLGDLNERLSQARSSLHSAEEIAKISPVALEAARRSEEQQRARYQSGLSTVVDVTTAEAALVQAESQNAIARLNVWRASAELAAAQGDLAPFRDMAASH